MSATDLKVSQTSSGLFAVTVHTYPRSSVVGRALVFAFVISSLSLSGIPGLSRVNDVVALAITGYATMQVFRRGGLVPSWTRAPALFLLSSLVFALLNTRSGFASYLSILPIWVGAISMALVIRDYKAETSALAAIILASAANCIAVVLGFDSFATYNPLAEFVSEFDISNRASGLVGNANVLAMQANFALLALIVLRPKARLNLVLVVWGLALHAVATSGSRKGLVLLFLITAYFVFFKHFEKSFNHARLLIALGILAIIVVAISQIESLINFLPIDNILALNRILLALSGQDTSFSERQLLASEATEFFLQRPIFGYGLDSFRHISIKSVYSHNNFLEIGVSGGIVLLLLYYSIYVVSWARLRKRHSRDHLTMLPWLFLACILSTDLWSVTYNLELMPIFLMLIAARSSQ